MYAVSNEPGETFEMCQGADRQTLSGYCRRRSFAFQCKCAWYCSKECQKANWRFHKLTCPEVERSSGVAKLIGSLGMNPLLMAFIRIGVIFDCGLLDNPQRLGFDMPFMARVDFAIEPSEILDFSGLYLNDRPVGEKLQGMIQVNALTTWDPTKQGPLTPEQLRLWREARAKYNTNGFAIDLVGLIEFVNCADDNSFISELFIPTVVVNMAREHEPLNANVAACLQCVNLNIRADKQNQLLLRTEMTEQDKEIICSASRNEETFPSRILKEKMKREPLYTNILN
ncbi:hypothetical protein K503DRAFT_188332 [Rhizopogon vinicolor AM-OR11-026]|uniref:MYND-type domain-containing protein n=1 Tax=Rhizopogon vinicolor AM-OR11-026 TaxID=1314800 RepID=A0A1B7MZP2_9AGAM|nr:hypothetical protein K503DRAFT_188332 [Rhizopogon vinicolor AM-OR11-026]